MQTHLRDRLLDEQEAANLLHISPRTLQRWRWAKVGPLYLKIGSRVRYTRSALEAYVRKSERPPTGEAVSIGALGERESR